MNRMKLVSLLFAFSLFAFSACLKTPDAQPCDYDACMVKAPEAEIQRVKAYLDSMGITATQHCSGLFYKIDSAGTGINPDACSNVNAAYVGKLTNGTIFDESKTGINFSLSGVIRGWTNGVPLVKEGGKITLYIPPTLGYGPTDFATIPANSILIFDIRLNRVY